jgi:TRAP-type mannitol/chloroaromatic compound transport system permease small subunit
MAPGSESEILYQGTEAMAKAVHFFTNLIGKITEAIARPASLLVFIMMVITSTEVISRYVFNHPTIWAWALNRQIFGVFILVAGTFTMFKGEHIRIEILYDHFPPKAKRIARWIALACFVLFMGVLVWQGSWMGWNSLMMKEKLAGAFRMPLYPFKILIPIGALLFLLQGIAVLSRREK